MEMLKKYFPYSFGAKSVADLVVKIIVLLVVGTVATWVIGLLSGIPVIGLLVGLVCGLIDLYVLISIVLSVLDYMKILK